MHAVAYRTSMLRSMHYRQTEGIFYTDQEWTFMPVSSVKSIWYFPHILYIYRVGREGQTVDINVWVHHADQEILGLRKMTEFYEGIKDNISEDLKDFMEYRLHFRVAAIYNHLFIRSFGAVADSTIRQFDQFVANHQPEFYKKIESLIIYKHLNVIGLWRRHHKLYNIFIKIRRFAHRLKKRF